MMISTTICLYLLAFFQGCQLAVEFNFPTLTMSTLEIRKVSPKLKQMQKIDIIPINIDVKHNFKLLEFIFLDLSFDYEKYVPDYKKLMFSMPDI